MSENMVTISAENLQKKIAENKELLVINVLAKQYYDDCHITGSINIPNDELIEKTASWEKDKEIVVYCATPTCPKSAKAYEILQGLGFTNLHEYPGGIQEWFQKGYEVSGPCAEEYLHKS